MRVALFGASGMIGGGLLRACLDDPDITSVVSVGRSPSGLSSPKLEELVVPDLFDLRAHQEVFRGVDACFYTIGVSSVGMTEEAYRRVTVDLTAAILDVVGAASPGVRVCFVSGMGTDGTGTSRTMWARVKGEAEKVVLEGPFEGWVFRPGVIQPTGGARSKVALYRVLYAALTPLFPLLRALFPAAVTTTGRVARAMIRAARSGYTRRVLETRDINELGGDGR